MRIQNSYPQYKIDLRSNTTSITSAIAATLGTDNLYYFPQNINNTYTA